MKIGPLSILILLISFGIMMSTILDWIPNNPLTNYKLIAALQFIIVGRLIVTKQRKKH
ncbi:hypothetical protein [Flavobacterium sp.]|uniref:hypothetical protein n=1 Tax=Flavobacterium sp. TaxID=239 RepID=UPI003D2689F2